MAPSSSAARRQFLADSAKMACGVGMLGLGLGLYAKQSKALPALALRPPGAGPEEDFLGACIRCGMCVRDCPYKILSLAKPETPVATGTPYFTARQGPCEMCEDIPCVKACPTGALNHGLTDINKAKMGLAVLIDHETCLNFLGLRCDVCYRVCPVIDKAITLELVPNTRTGRHTMFLPTVHSEHCTGCGKCEKSCVLQEAAIRVLPAKLAKGALGEHYRLGWEEKQKAGHALIDENSMVDLPDRLPEGVTLPNHDDPASGGVAVPSAPPGMPGSVAGPVPSSPPGLGGGK
ncbi:MAG TPA: ferredoxin-type protein NapG [Rhodocyclaceae bacterium]|jgi:ferredoxin-type protein NapG|nr:ferredoxin-type protein NapG [Rhodocyclaceae bacterium]HMW76652.1 ferredoxin-type protein NapG [Rhodocyclaceae bacterium]HNL20387.1 ferredoxin-type protein NapG [Rhodocyclaceae bacterium]HNM80632.1 ferredoxin-type protein NapG [Rhodocyclaceae bacterium]